MEVADIIAEVAERLRSVAGIRAVVLGGSRTSGTHTPASDIDIGLYYHDPASFDLAALAEVAREIDDAHRRDLVTPISGWGPWVIGGGWLTVGGRSVDLIYRDLARVRHWIAEAEAGRFELHYQWGHPHGFATTIYAAEVATCRVLWEADAVVSALKARLMPYPPALGEALVRQGLGEATFMATVARHGLPRRDISYTAGCIFRSIACLMMALCALNERWLLNEKGAAALAATLPRTLPYLAERVAAIYATLGPSETALDEAVAALEALIHECAELAQMGSHTY